MNESVTALSKTPGTAIGTAYRDIIRRAAKECSWLADGGRAYDIDIDGKTISISTLFENLIGIILPEAYVGNARFGVQDNIWFASCDIVYVPGLAIKDFDDLGIQADPDNEIEFSIDGVDSIFPDYYREMKGLEWGRLYDFYHEKFFNSEELGKMVADLMADEHVTAKKGAFEYALQKVSGPEPDLSLLHIRLFEESTKRTVFTRQTREAKERGESNCPMCVLENGPNRVKLYGIKEMDADHASAWSRGGDTSLENCVILCATHNRMKGNR